MRRTLPLLLAVTAGLPACTAVGAWLYDDPSFSLRSVTVRRGEADSIDFVFVACNRNDYDLTGERFNTRLAVAGRTVGQGERLQPLFLGMRDTSRFTVSLPLSDPSLVTGPQVRLYELVASSVVHTPVGDRDVVIRLKGRVQRDGENLLWRGESGRPCRPGLSQLPASFDPRPAGPEKQKEQPPPPRNGPGLRPEPPGRPTP